jgi:hypothetical protein
MPTQAWDGTEYRTRTAMAMNYPEEPRLSGQTAVVIGGVSAWRRAVGRAYSWSSAGCDRMIGMSGPARTGVAALTKPGGENSYA